MKMKQVVELINVGDQQSEVNELMAQVKEAISLMVHPSDSGNFLLFEGKKANGVKPIKDTFLHQLNAKGWILEHRLDVGVTNTKPGPIDAVHPVGSKFFAVEWETGNIASSHRALNKIMTGIINGVLVGGVLILPSREMYEYLTDRVGNFRELSPYFDVWAKANYPITQGFLAVIEIEHDGLTSDEDARISKGTDGRALV
ncbi:restriction endonuclease [Ammoniphilus sp. CFH 90114]|uniref:restriction endonuclease n=1 Tax=Ammoniphilus sp. CFH 90114 TaxID=2493665 RepID=UPI00100FBD9E|nr:restriction endonuclease [Ammoniphilus sp. CFH 90114]RXT08862.1 restriction endonuclease [Ammoniphilus sp. CFH 90114]